jgi:predicted nucleotidyltransferase
MAARVGIDPNRIAAFCERHHIRKLALFGSVLRDDFRPDSDVDVLVEFAPNTRVSLFDMVDLEQELSEVVGRRVDLRTPGDLSRYIRQRVLDSAEVLYVRG